MGNKKKRIQRIIDVIMITGPNIHETKSTCEYIKKRVVENHLKNGETDFTVADVGVMCHAMIPSHEFENKFKVTADSAEDVKNHRKVIADMVKDLKKCIFVFDGCKPPLEMHEAMMLDENRYEEPFLLTLTIYRDVERQIVRGIAATFNE